VLLQQAPASVSALQAAMQANFDRLSPRLQQVATFVMHEPLRVATESVMDLSAHLQVPPATLTRFAQVMGTPSFKELQALFKAQYVERPRDYLERIRRSRIDPPGEATSTSLHEDFAQASIQAVQMTALELSLPSLQAAVALLHGASEIWIHGVRRAYPVAAYLQYLLLKLQLRASMLDTGGGFLAPSLGRLHPGGVLLMVTYSPHAGESEQVIAAACQAGVPIIAITDPTPSPHARDMAVRFEIREGEVMGFRSLAASMYLAQTLAVELARVRAAPEVEGKGERAAAVTPRSGPVPAAARSRPSSRPRSG
jgi:DNA-binding MurR/RpiR family transcriptional regulator